MNRKPKASKNNAKDVETPQLPTAPRQQPNHRQALQFLDSIVAMAPVSRQAHVQAQQALQQLSGVIQELETLEKKELAQLKEELAQSEAELKRLKKAKQ